MLKYNLLEVVKCIRDKRQETRDKRRWIRSFGAVGLFALMGFALLNGANANAKEKVSDRWKNVGRLKQVKEEAVDGAIPKSIINYANDKYKSLLLAASQYDNTIGRNIFEASLGEPFVVLNDSNQEVYYFPVMAKDEIIYVIAVINTTEGLTMSGSYEMVDMLNSEMNDTTLIVYDQEKEIVETVNIMDEEYEEVVEKTADFVEDMEAVDVNENIIYENDDVEETAYSPMFSYNQTTGSTTGKTCALYNPRYQGATRICWACAVATIVNYRKGTNISGIDVCDIMNREYKGATISVSKDALKKYGIYYEITNSQLQWSLIKKNIDKKYPIYISARNVADSDSRHAVTLYGYMNHNSDKYITVWDSAANNYQTVTYTQSNNMAFIFSLVAYRWNKSASAYY